MRSFLFVLAVSALLYPLAAVDATLDQVPAPARATIEREAGGKSVTAVKRDRVDGRDAWLASIAERGFDTKVWVADDGTLLHRRDLSEVNEVTSEVADAARAAGREVRDVVRKATANDERLGIEQVPEVPRAALRREAGTDPILSVRRHTSAGREIWTAQIGGARTRTVSVDAEGKVVL